MALTQVVVNDTSVFSLSNENEQGKFRGDNVYPIFATKIVVHIVNNMVQMVRFVLE